MDSSTASDDIPYCWCNEEPIGSHQVSINWKKKRKKETERLNSVRSIAS